MMDTFLGFTLTLIVAAILALALKRINVSPVAGYIIAGLIIGPGLKLVDANSEFVVIASNIGIALIFFEIGLTAKLGFLRRHGHEILMIALIELFLNALLVTIFGISLGLPLITIMVLGLMALDTSSPIVFKLATSANKLSKQALVQILGVSTIEDLILMTGIALIPAFARLGQLQIEEAFLSISFVVIAALVTIVVTIQVLPKVFSFINKDDDQEVTVLMLLVVAIGFGILGGYMGISFALGSFIAGLAASLIDIPSEAVKRIVSLRDLFAMIFFISIGLGMPGIESGSALAYALIIAAGIIILKFFAFSSAAWLSGNRLTEALRWGFYMLPISEFAMIVAREGYKYNYINESMFMASALAIVISVLLSSRLVKNDEVYAAKGAALIPLRIRSGVENTAIKVRAFLFERLLAARGGRKLLMGVASKVAIIIVVVAVGSLIIQMLGEAQVLREIVLIAQLGTVITVFLTVLVEIIRLGKEISRITELTQPKKTKDLGRARVVIRNCVYLIIALMIATIVVLSVMTHFRGILPEHIGTATTNLFTFAILFAFISVVFYLAYNRINGMLEALERTVESI